MVKDSDSDSDSETPPCSLKPILMPYVFPSYVSFKIRLKLRIMI